MEGLFAFLYPSHRDWRVTYRYRGIGGHGGRKTTTVRARSAVKAMERVNREGYGIRTAESAERA